MERPRVPTVTEPDWRVWLRIGLLGFGGPAGQIGLLHRETVAQRRWVDEDTFGHALALTSLLPGPEAHQTATYVGWLRGGLRSALTAAALFVAPGAVITALLAGAYLQLGSVGAVGGFFTGLQAAAVALIVLALSGMARRVLTSSTAWALAVGTFLLTTVTVVPYPAIAVVLAGAGWLSVRARPLGPPLGPLSGPPPGPPPGPPASSPSDAAPTAPAGISAELRRRTILCGLSLIGIVLLGSVLLMAFAGGTVRALTGTLLISAFTFGGAYAILDFATAQLVERQGLLTAADMATGLGLAESTPGPLILVLEFASFIALASGAGQLWWLLGGLGALLAVAILFIAATGIVLVAAPYADALRSSPRMRRALRAVAASVVGVLASLALVLIASVCFTDAATVREGPLQFTVPDLRTVDWGVVVIALLAGVGLATRRPLWLIAIGCGVIGAVLTLG